MEKLLEVARNTAWLMFELVHAEASPELPDHLREECVKAYVQATIAIEEYKNGMPTLPPRRL
jgi:hypothetical protein